MLAPIAKTGLVAFLSSAIGYSAAKALDRPKAPPLALPAGNAKGLEGFDGGDLGDGTWTPATDADVKSDSMVAAYAAQLKRPVGKQAYSEHNGRIWRLKVVSKDTDPDFTKHAKDVRGWIWNCAAAAPDDDDSSGLGAADLGRLRSHLGAFDGADLGNGAPGGPTLNSDALLLNLTADQKSKMLAAIDAGMSPADIFIAAGLRTKADIAQAQKPQAPKIVNLGPAAGPSTADKIADAAAAAIRAANGEPPLQKDCHCDDCKAGTLKGHGDEVCDFGCVAGEEVAGEDGGVGSWERRFRAFGRDFAVTIGDKAPPAAPASPDPAAQKAGEKAIEAAKAGGAKGVDLGAASWEERFTTLGAADQTARDWASALATGGGGILNAFVPGSGTLVKAGTDKLIDAVDKKTGHKTREQEAADAAQAKAAKAAQDSGTKGHDSMSTEQTEHADLGANLPAPSPGSYGAKYNATTRAWYWPAKSPGFYTSPAGLKTWQAKLLAARAAYARNNQAYAGGGAYAGKTPAQLVKILRTKSKLLAWAQNALTACQQGTGPDQYAAASPYAFDPNADQSAIYAGDDSTYPDDGGGDFDDSDLNGAVPVDGDTADLGATPAQRALANEKRLAAREHSEIRTDQTIIHHERATLALRDKQLAAARREIARLKAHHKQHGAGVHEHHLQALDHHLHELGLENRALEHALATGEHLLRMSNAHMEHEIRRHGGDGTGGRPPGLAGAEGAPPAAAPAAPTGKIPRLVALPGGAGNLGYHGGPGAAYNRRMLPPGGYGGQGYPPPGGYGQPQVDPDAPYGRDQYGQPLPPPYGLLGEGGGTEGAEEGTAGAPPGRPAEAQPAPGDDSTGGTGCACSAPKSRGPYMDDDLAGGYGRASNDGT